MVSPGNGWYVGKIVAADGTASYADSVDLNVPVDTGYRVFVYYRATSGDPWGIYGYSPGTVDVTPPASARSASPPPRARGSQAQGSALPVTWTHQRRRRHAASSASGWSAPANGWYVGKIVAADGPASYADAVDLNVPVDTRLPRLRLLPRHQRRPLGHLRLLAGHGRRDRRLQRDQRHRPHGHDAARPRAAPCRSPGRTNAAVAGGQFSIWVVSPGNGWYVGKIDAADGTASYADSVDLNVPVDAGYRVFVYYRATERRPLGHLRLLAGHGRRDAPASAPSPSPPPRARQPGPGQRPAGHLDDQRRGRQRPVQHLGGQPRQRLVRGQDRRRRRPRQLRRPVDLNVPADTGYRVFVYYRATSGDPWGLYGYSAGTVDVTAPADEYTLTVNTIGNGSVAKAPDQATYHDGDTVELTPTADPGWTFSGWSGDLSGSDNPATVTIHGDIAATATFTQDEYTLTVNTIGSGASPSPRPGHLPRRRHGRADPDRRPRLDVLGLERRLERQRQPGDRDHPR